MENGRLNREIWAVVISFTAVLMLVSLFTADVRDRSFNTPSGLANTHNWGGFVGAYLADMLLQGLGLTAYLLPAFLGLSAYKLFQPSFKAVQPVKIFGYGVFLVSVAVLISLLVDSENAREAGGILGGFLKESMLVPWFGPISATLITLVALLLSVMLLTQYSLLDLWQRARKQSMELKRSLTPIISHQLQELRERSEKRRGENVKKERSDYKPPPIVLKEEAKAEAAVRNSKKPAAAQEQFKLPEMSEGYTVAARQFAGCSGEPAAEARQRHTARQLDHSAKEAGRFWRRGRSHGGASRTGDHRVRVQTRGRCQSPPYRLAG